MWLSRAESDIEAMRRCPFGDFAAARLRIFDSFGKAETGSPITIDRQSFGGRLIYAN